MPAKFDQISLTVSNINVSAHRVGQVTELSDSRTFGTRVFFRDRDDRLPAPEYRHGPGIQ